MEPMSVFGLLKVLGDVGLVGLILVLWWQDMRRIARIQEQYKSDMAEQRRMYESNVSLVKDYQSVASDLKDVVILNTQILTTLSDEIRQNEYCPMQRVEKKRAIKEVGGG